MKKRKDELNSFTAPSYEPYKWKKWRWNSSINNPKLLSLSNCHFEWNINTLTAIRRKTKKNMNGSSICVKNDQLKFGFKTLFINFELDEKIKIK